MMRQTKYQGDAFVRLRLAMIALVVLCMVIGACLPASRRSDSRAETVSPPKANPVTAEDFLEEGNFYLDRPGMGLRAMASFQKVLKLNPTPAFESEAWSGIGRVHQTNKEYEKAEKCFLKATQIDPEAPLPWTCLATLYFQQATGTSQLDFNLMRKSIECSSKAIAVDPMYANAYVARGRARQILGQKREAASEYIAALDLGLTDYAATIVRGYLANAWFDAGEYELAIEQWQLLLALPDADPRARTTWEKMIVVAQKAMGYRADE